MNIKNKRGQSTVEYILLVTAVIAIIIVFTTGMFKTQLNTAVNTAAQDMNNMEGVLSSSHDAVVKPTTPPDTTPPYSINVANGVS